jgi:hypothetical protein
MYEYDPEDMLGEYYSEIDMLWLIIITILLFLILLIII